MKTINQLLPIMENEEMEPVINGRLLHDFLRIETPYTQWFDRMKEYGFIEGVDFRELLELSQKSEDSRIVKRGLITHTLSLDMAKEVAMVQRNE